MAVPQDTSLNGLRNSIITSIFGRRIGMTYGNSSDTGDYLVGPKDIRVQVEGVSSAGSTIVSTSVANPLSAWGVSLLGSSAASATTGYQLAAPVPGIFKTLIVPTTGYAVIGTTAGGAFIASTGSAASTHGTITMSGKGCNVLLFGVTTNLWAALTQQYSSVSTNVSFT